MKRHLEENRLEKRRARFQKCGIAVTETPPKREGGIVILPDESPLACRANVHGFGHVQYVLRLRLRSDDPNLIICGFSIETDVEPVRVLEPGEKVPRKYVSWGPEEDILNERVNQQFGPTLYREGLLLGLGLRSPATAKGFQPASITVAVLDQFDHWYDEDLYIIVHDETRDVEAGILAGAHRKSGLFEPDDDEAPPLQSPDHTVAGLGTMKKISLRRAEQKD